jgi:hypothetical protein
MRSVSIVYKKQSHHEQPFLRDMPHTRTLVKRSVDEYYTRLIEK